MKTHRSYFVVLLMLLLPVLLKSQATYWGVTSKGGTSNVGTICYWEDGSSENTIVHSFSYGDGDSPVGAMVRASDDLLYGTTPGGNIDYGVIYSFDPVAHQYLKMYAFPGGNDGMYPAGFLLAHPDGKLYGMTRNGGEDQRGTIYAYEPGASSVIILKNFSGEDGAYPEGGLTLATNGLLYGLTSYGGENNTGVLFSFNNVSGEYKKLADFGYVIGSLPVCTLIQASNGKLYGVTPKGGSSNAGVLFEYDIIGNTLLKLVDFDGVTTGSEPVGGLTETGDGILFGMTRQNEIAETNTHGAIYSYDLIHYQFSRLFVFDGENGSSPTGSFILTDNLKLLGVTDKGGTSDLGVYFEYNTADNTYSKILDFQNTNGAAPVYTRLLKVVNTGLSQIVPDTEINVFPNPAKEYITLQFGADYKTMNCVVYDMKGKIILQSKARKQKQITINTSSLPAGSYLIEVTTEEGTIKKKIRIL